MVVRRAQPQRLYAAGLIECVNDEAALERGDALDERPGVGVGLRLGPQSEHVTRQVASRRSS